MLLNLVPINARTLESSIIAFCLFIAYSNVRRVERKNIAADINLKKIIYIFTGWFVKMNDLFSLFEYHRSFCDPFRKKSRLSYNKRRTLFESELR